MIDFLCDYKIKDSTSVRKSSPLRRDKDFLIQVWHLITIKYVQVCIKNVVQKMLEMKILRQPNWTVHKWNVNHFFNKITFFYGQNLRNGRQYTYFLVL